MIVCSQSKAMDDKLADFNREMSSVKGRPVFPSVHESYNHFYLQCAGSLDCALKNTCILWDADEPVENRIYLAICRIFEENKRHAQG